MAVWPESIPPPSFYIQGREFEADRFINKRNKDQRLQGFKASIIKGTAIVGRITASHVDGVIEVYRVYAGRAENKLTIYQWLIVL